MRKRGDKSETCATCVMRSREQGSKEERYVGAGIIPGSTIIFLRWSNLLKPMDETKRDVREAVKPGGIGHRPAAIFFPTSRTRILLVQALFKLSCK